MGGPSRPAHALLFLLEPAEGSDAQRGNPRPLQWRSLERRLNLGAIDFVDGPGHLRIALHDRPNDVAPLPHDEKVAEEARCSVGMMWKVWERGTPQLAVEIVSPSDAPEPSWTEKLKRYYALGVDELVRFDPDGPDGARLRVWDRVQGDLVERVVKNEVTACEVLGLWWLVRPGAGLEAALRLARDPQGQELLPNGQEAETTARQAAERRVAEVEEELRKRG